MLKNNLEKLDKKINEIIDMFDMNDLKIEYCLKQEIL